MKRVFTVLEVLAATVILGLLAIAIVPLTRRLVSDENRVVGQQQARSWLLLQGDRVTAQIDPDQRVMPIEDHPSWFLHVTILSARLPPPRPGEAPLRPGYRWGMLSVQTAATHQGTVLAERLVLLRGGE